MRRLSKVGLIVALMAWAIGFLAQSRAQTSKPDPCQRRLERIAKEVNSLWHHPVKGKMMRQHHKREVMERWLKKQIKEPLGCPVVRFPYKFFPEELSEKWQMPILLADPKPHPDKRQFAVIALPDPKTREVGEFIATTLPPPKNLQERLAQVRQQAQAAHCLSHLRQIGTALMQYLMDYDERFPPMKTFDQTQKALNPYLRNLSVFNCPATKKPYQPNPHLHLKSLKDISKPSETPAFYDAQPHPDGMRGVAFVDGHSKMLSLKEWQSLQKQHDLPMAR